jgi:hypothetical protein
MKSWSVRTIGKAPNVRIALRQSCRRNFLCSLPTETPVRWVPANRMAGLVVAEAAVADAAVEAARITIDSDSGYLQAKLCR